MIWVVRYPSWNEVLRTYESMVAHQYQVDIYVSHNCSNDDN